MKLSRSLLFFSSDQRVHQKQYKCPDCLKWFKNLAVHNDRRQNEPGVCERKEAPSKITLKPDGTRKFFCRI